MRIYVLPLIVFLCLSTAFAFGQCTTGAAAGGSTFGNNTSTGAQAWTNPQNARVQNNVFATASLTVGVGAVINTQYLAATGFNFNIPTSATICGITVTVVRQRLDLLLGNITDNSVKLISGGAIGGTEHASTSSWSTTEQTITYGGPSDTWGLALTPAIVNASNFGAGVSAKLSGGALISLLLSAGVDYISIAVTYNPTTSLPITLLNFSTVSQGNSNVLSWTATDNDEGDNVVVQRSGDGKTWQDLTTIAAAADTLQYTYTDYSPLSGNNYYRLYLENKSGMDSYSNIDLISGQAAVGITCYPNPIVSVINIASSKAIEHVILRDMQGRVLETRTLNTGSNTLQLPAGMLPPGIYILQVDGTLVKLVKQ